MTAHRNLIGELEDAVAAKDIGRRAEILRRVADLFVSGSATYSDDQIALFDDVMGRLVAEIDDTARAAFGQRLDAMPNAPPGTLRTLALDDAIEVSGPILSQSAQLSEATMVEAASTKSQDHLLAISRRSALPEAVTDVLVDRGNREVALSTAINSGAKFSEHGYSTLVKRAETDDGLALSIWARPEVPRPHLLKLFADASETVRLKLEAVDHGKGTLLQDMIAQASNKIQAKARERSADYALAYAQVHTLHHSRKLDEARLAAFASAGKFDETAIALSLMCRLPIDLTERLMVQKQSEQMTVIARALGLSWDTAKAILSLQALAFQANAKGDAARELEARHATFAKLTPDTAKKALNFYRMREQATMHKAGNADRVN
jgi:uncharacterized protein (DUF2336 family)